MEVSGKRDAMSEDDLICLPCNLDGLLEPVYGYCQDCQEHLCETCFKHHRRSKASRNHVLLDKEAMPNDQKMPTAKSSDATDFCASHTDKRLEFYCSKHKAITCYVCVTLRHKACEVDYIPDISGNVSESSEFVNLLTQLKILKDACEAGIKHSKTVRDEIDTCHVKFIEELKLFRKEINDCINKIEAELTKCIELHVCTAKRKLTDMNEACQEIAKEAEDTELLLNKLNDGRQQNKLFIEMKKAEEPLSRLRNKEKQTRVKNETVGSFEFVHNHNLIDLLKIENFGKIVFEESREMTGEEATATEREQPASERSILPSENKPVNLQLIGEISVRKNCDIRGIVLIPPRNIIIADYSDKCVKLIDKKSSALVSELRLSSGPCDIISLPQNKLAVAHVDEKCIQVLSLTETGLSTDRRFSVRGRCHGLAFCEDKFVVACDFNPGKVFILNLGGNELKAFDSPGLFSGPERVVVSKDKKSIYVSDYYTRHRLVNIDWQGNVLQTFQTKRYKKPIGIQELPDGTVLVCFRDSNAIVRLSSGCTVCNITGLEEANLCYPTAIAYCEKQRKLYVSCAPRTRLPPNTINVFDVKWS